MSRPSLAAAILLLAPLSGRAATLTVCPGGSCDHSTLQDAIDAATSGDTLLLQAGSTFVEDVLVEYKDLIIVGDTASPAVVRATGTKSRSFRVQGSTVELSGLTIDGDGNACIRAQDSSELVMSDMTVEQCQARVNGPGVLLEDSSSLVADRVAFRFNQTGSSGDIAAMRRGGAINANVDMVVTLRECTFTDNEAGIGGSVYGEMSTVFVEGCTFDGGAAWGEGGGHIYAGNDGLLEVVDSTFTGAYSDGVGGSVLISDNRTSLSGSTWSGSNNADGRGGAIWVDHGGTETMVIEDCTFDGSWSGGHGGAIYFWHTWTNAKLSVVGSTFRNNSSSRDGGAIYLDGASGTHLDILDSTFESNSASAYGGAVRLWNMHDVLVERSVFEASSANRGGAFAMDYINASAFHNNLFVDNYAGNGGVMFTEDGFMDFFNNTLVGNGDISLSISDFEMFVLNNIVDSESQGPGIYFDTMSEYNDGIDYNLLYDNTTYDIRVIDSTGRVEVVQDNLFGPAPLLDEANDYAPLDGSPAIDAGHPDPIWNDIDGTRNDIGWTGWRGTISLDLIDQDEDDFVYTEDCNDVDDTVYPGAEEVCDGQINDCDTLELPPDEVDGDGDGYVVCEVTGPWAGDPDVVGGGDCDDDDPLLSPATIWYRDADGDTFGDAATTAGPQCDQPDGYVLDDSDCDDDDLYARPGAIWFADTDDDGYGDASEPMSSCTRPDGYVPSGDDCDDGDATISPNAYEICDGLVNVCGHELSEVEQDDDADHYVECVVDDTWRGVASVWGGGDCDDDEGSVYPGAPELCDGLANDCDDPVLPLDEVDRDGDGFVECEAWSGGDDVDGGGDCDDLQEAVYPGADEVCDGLVDDCDATGLPAVEADEDGDGYVACTFAGESWLGGTEVVGDRDCDDDDPTRFPGAPELCTGIMEDCDGEFPADEVDGDSDRWVPCELDGEWLGTGPVDGGGDCDDDEPAVYPGADALCDGLVNDCAGGALSVDEVDRDGDGFVVCAVETWRGDGDVEGGGDCDDLRDVVYPGATELCDGVVDDCAATALADDESDLDGDGYVACAFDDASWLGGVGVVGDADCADDDPTRFPGAPELCTGVVEDCDGTALPDDEVDGDGDHYVECAIEGTWIGDPKVVGGGDCDDEASGVHPGAQEVCDQDDVDEDCDGLADDEDDSVDGASTWYLDLDEDGYGMDLGDGQAFCDAPEGWVDDHTDCDDLDPGSYPGAVEEAYDWVDQDCDGEDLCDVDLDGFDSTACLGLDCDDADPDVHPDATEVWYDGVDGDCDGGSDDDQDGDGFEVGEDCNDMDATIHPGAEDEPEDGVDSDCDGEDGEPKGGCSHTPGTGPAGLGLLLVLLGRRRGWRDASTPIVR